MQLAMKAYVSRSGDLTADNFGSRSTPNLVIVHSQGDRPFAGWHYPSSCMQTCHPTAISAGWVEIVALTSATRYYQSQQQHLGEAQQQQIPRRISSGPAARQIGG
jgi:hypothetical protein